MGGENLENGVKNTEVVNAVRVGGWVVGHKEPEESEDKILQAEGKPIDVAPGGVFGDNTRKKPREE